MCPYVDNNVSLKLLDREVDKSRVLGGKEKEPWQTALLISK